VTVTATGGSDQIIRHSARPHVTPLAWPQEKRRISVFIRRASTIARIANSQID